MKLTNPNSLFSDRSRPLHKLTITSCFLRSTPTINLTMCMLKLVHQAIFSATSFAPVCDNPVLTLMFPTWISELRKPLKAKKCVARELFSASYLIAW
ncbi:putative D-xylulose reductase A [Fusarium oxysporum f. sp. albedinis]|nr:putative D-xylulose reductase A [Fusarium oxysporum f. sp. albedinis]